MTRHPGEWGEELAASTLSGPSRAPGAGAARVPGLTLVAHPDVRRVGERVALPEISSGRAVELSRLVPLFSPPDGGAPEPLADLHLSRNPLLLGPGTEPGSVLLRRGGAPTSLEVDGRPVGSEHLCSAADVERGAVLLLAERIVLLLHRMPPAPPREAERFGLLGDGAAMARLRADIRRVADLEVAVLLRGETGTGKELVARAIHRSSPRRSRPYLAVNMGAIPPPLAAAELFGAARGAFTGADQRRTGYFSQAHNGTLFLDEIGETPAEVQALLLRALETGEVQPVGAEAPRRVDVRVLAATDADLEEAIAAGRFRAPLLHRLNGYEIRLPALCERREDFGQLFFAFLRQELETLGEEERLADPGPRGAAWLPAPLVARLAAADWPGNVRQLRNAARQIAISNRGAAQAVLPPAVLGPLERQRAGASGERPAAPAPRPTYRRPADVGEEELLAALAANRWKLVATAAQLGLSRTALYTLVDRCAGIRKAADLDRAEIAEAMARHGKDLDAMVEELRVSRHGLQLRMTELGL
ncbi:MAG TPA: sigma 54-interacting transcriptional regulator [Thermoanaerobaculia bacterium]|nr:sigma 54-interacting transcriptional regulator [Thermoanaerobaculia bacterium]